MTFRSKIFLTALTASAFAVAAATSLVSASVRRNLEQRIEHELAGNARMAAELLAHRTTASEEELDAEADALGRILSARVTFIAADGRVVGDSDLTPEEIKRSRITARVRRSSTPGGWVWAAPGATAPPSTAT